MSESREIRIALRSGHVVVCRISVASTIIVGPGPRPKRDESLLASCIDDERVLTVGIEVDLPSGEADDAESGNIERNITIPLEGNLAVSIRISVASTIIVGPGPRPRQDETILVRRIDEEQVLTLGAIVAALETASIHVGSGTPVGGGGGP